MSLPIYRKVLNKIKGIPNVYIDEFKFFLQKHLPKNPKILEAGACDGKDTLQMAVLWPNGIIYAFEPVPELYKKSENYIGTIENVQLFPYALSNKSGMIEINVSGGISEASSSILNPKLHLELHPEVTFEKSISIESITIDQWRMKYNIPNIDFLWLDLQGAEHLALAGAEDTLKSVKLIFTEVNLVENYSGTMLYKDLKMWLASHGFEVFKEFLDYEDGGNVLFIKK